jgi:O-acetyl-ADP-ribose deacetylase (regulator of RNase III)
MDGKARIKILRGDLTDQDADAIVNAANTDLALGGGVAGAIRRKGGPAIQQECDRIGPIEVGEAAVTGGGRLRARYVIHAASMRLGQAATEPNLRASTRASLRRARELGLRTIALPAIGTGIAGFPMGRCAEVMLEEALGHLEGETSLEEVRFVLYDTCAFETFRRCFGALERNVPPGA